MLTAMDDAYTTLGERYRTPAHPHVLAALGRAMWNFFALEESVVAIFYETRDSDWNALRAEDAGKKEERLRLLADQLEECGAGPAVRVAIEQAADAFKIARKRYRNVFSHSHPYTAGFDDDGRYLPGLAHLSKRGRDQDRRFDSPAALLEAAHRIEDAVDALGEAQAVVAAWAVMQELEDGYTD